MKAYLYPKCNTLIVRWSDQSVGFGEVKINSDSDGNALIDSEYMGREFVIKVLTALVMSAKFANMDDQP